MERGMSQRLAIIALGVITIILIGVSIVIAIRLQQQQAPGDAGAADVPGGEACTPNDGVIECLSGFCCECDSGSKCLVESYGNCAAYCNAIDGGSDGGDTGTGSKGQGETCNPGLGECVSPFVCTQTDFGSGEYVCNDPGDQSACATGAACGGANGYYSFVCSTLDQFGRCNADRQTHSTFADAAARVQNTGGCGQVDEIWVGGTCGGQLCGDFQIFTAGCTTDTVTTYTCNMTTFQCEAINDSSGQYASLTDCEAACIETVITEPPVCGDPCDPEDTNSCPQDHTCSPTTNTCTLNACLTGEADCEDGCTIIPDTALFDQENTNLLLGLLLILTAIILVRVDISGTANKLLLSFDDHILRSQTKKARQRLDKQREIFENKFEKD